MRVEIVDIEAEVSFLEKTWIKEMEIQIKRGFCTEIICLADGTKRSIWYWTEGKLTNEIDQGISMNIWITELGKKDIIVRQD